jgi:hypothetical protein
MVTRRERFERVYALTEAIAPAEALREVDPAEAEDVLLRKSIASDGLTRLNGVRFFLKRPVSAAELTGWRAGWIASGAAIEVKVEGWKQAQLAPGADAEVLAGLDAGHVPRAWATLGTTTDNEVTFLSPLDPVSARGRAKPLFGFDYTWEVYKPADQRQYGYYTMPILWGDRLVGRFDPKLDRATGTLVILGLWLEDDALARDAAFGEALRLGMARFLRLLDARGIDVSAVRQPSLRVALRAAVRGTRSPGRPTADGGPARSSGVRC